jgi:hypothetical protein
MPDIVMNGKQMGDSDVIAEEEEEEEEEEVQELRNRSLSRKNKDYENSEKVSQRGPQNNRGVGPGEEDTRPRTSPRTVESHSSVMPPMPEAKNMAWDYFFMTDNMPGSSLDPEEDVSRNGGNFGNVENVGVGFAGVGDLRGGVEGGGGEIDEVEPKTPEKAGDKMDPVVEEEEEGGVEKNERKQMEHSKTAPPEFSAVNLTGRKGGSVPSVNLMQVLNKIDDHFLKASESAQDVCKMLEATRLHYHSNFADNRGIIGLPWLLVFKFFVYLTLCFGCLCF